MEAFNRKEHYHSELDGAKRSGNKDQEEYWKELYRDERTRKTVQYEIR